MLWEDALWWLGTPDQAKWTIVCGAQHRYYAEQDTDTPPSDNWSERAGFASGHIKLTYQARRLELVHDAVIV